MASNSTSYRLNGTAVPYISWAVAVLSVVPVGLVALGILTWYFVLARWHKRQIKHAARTWRPLTLRCPSLLLLLGVTGSLVILLESASLAFGRDRPTDSARATTTVDLVVVRTDVLSSSASSAELGATSTSHTLPDALGPLQSQGIRSSSAPRPTVGWLTVPSPTVHSSTGTPASSPPPRNVGWLNDGGGSSWMSWETEYFIGTFLPTLVASLYAIPWKILDHDTRSLEPFAQLARPGGGTASETILLRYDGLPGLLRGLRTTARLAAHAPVAISTVLKYGAALLSPLAAESVRLRLEGPCLQDWRARCTGTLQASDPVVRVTQALLCLMGCAVFAYVLLIGATWRRGGYGVESDPRSIVGIAGVSLNPFLAPVLRRNELQNEDGALSVRKAVRALGATTFSFGYVALAPGQRAEYAIVVSGESTALVKEGRAVHAEREGGFSQAGHETERAVPKERRRFVMSGLMLKLVGFGVYLGGLVFLIMWYRLSPNTDTGFERFMNSQSTFGVRFLFTCFGVLVGLGWGSIFTDIATMAPVWNMSRRPTSAERSILMQLSPSPYVGLILYLSRGQHLLGLLALTVILSDFLPIFLANVPFSNSITYATFEACVWLSVALLVFMLALVVTLAGRLLLRPPRYAADLRTLGGVLHLTCGSEAVQRQLRELAVSGDSAAKERVEGLKSTKYALSRASDQDRGLCVTVHGT